MSDMNKVILALAFVAACGKDCPTAPPPPNDGVGSGGCKIIKVAPDDREYVTAQLAHFIADQDEVCEHMIEGWNRSYYLRGTSARFRCVCPITAPTSR